MAYDDSYLKLGQSIAKNYQANLDKLQQQRQIDQTTQETPGRAEHLLGSFTRGAANFLGSIPQGAEALGYGAINKVFGTNYNPETMLTPFDAVSKTIRKLGEVGDLNPEYQNDFSTQLASGAGTLAAAAPFGWLKALGYGLSALAGVGESQSDYAQKLSDGTTKFDPNAQFLNSLAGAAFGASNLIPIAGAFGRAGTAKKFIENLEKGKKLSKGKYIGGQGLRTGLEEFIQESGENVGRDFVAKELYDPNREIGSTAGTEGAVGGVLGGALGAGAAALGLKYGKFGKLADYYQSLPKQEKQAQLEEARKANLPENININPVTNQEYQDKNLIKANEQIARYQQTLDENAATADPKILDLLNERINNIRKEISDTYFAKDKDGKYVKNEIERQEAEDFLATTTPANNIIIESPFNTDFQAPDTSGINVEDITNKRDLKKYGKLFASQSEIPKVELPIVQEGQTSPIFDIVDQEGKADTGKIRSLREKLKKIEDAYPSMTAKEKIQAKKILQQGNETINRALESDMLDTQASSKVPSTFGIETGTEEVITSNKGTPYATKASALRKLKKQKLDNTHQVIPFKGGYALAPKLQGVSGITVEEIFPETVQAVPGIEGIKVEELPPEVLNDLIFSKEFERDLVNKYSDNKPSNPIMAEALQSVKDARTEAERRKALRKAYDAAVEERKAKEIEEAYRQRELQDAVAPVTPEKVEVAQKPNTEEKIDEIPPEGFTPEEWSSLPTEIKNIILKDLENKKKEIKNQEELKPYKKDLSDLIEEADKEGINTSYYKALLKKDKLSPVYLHDAIQNLDYKIRSSIPEHFRNGEFDLEKVDPNEIKALIKKESIRRDSFERIFYKKLTDEIDKLPAYNYKQQQKRLGYQLWADDVLKSTYSDTAGLEDFQEVLKAVRREKNGIIVARSGFPYKTAKIAQAQLKRQKLTDTHEVIPYEDGFALKEKTKEAYRQRELQNAVAPVTPKGVEEPFSGIMHTLRNEEDLSSVLDTGLQASSNVGTKNSQAIGGGITLEYDPKDLNIQKKDYRSEEGTISSQNNAKPIRVLVDISDVPGLKEASGGESQATVLINQLEQLLPPNTDLDQFYTDIAGFTLAVEFNEGPRARAENLAVVRKKYGDKVAKFLKENTKQLNEAMNNPDGTEAFTLNDYLINIKRKVGDIPLFTYEVNEDGQPINIIPFENTTNAQQIQETTQPNGNVLNQEGTQKVQEVPTSETSTGISESGQGTQVQEVEVTQTPIEDRIDEINNRLDELDLQLEQTESGSKKNTLLFNETKALEKERKLLEKALKQGETELPTQEVAKEPTKVLTENDNNLILTKSGKPYKTEAAAKRGLTSKELNDTHEVISYEEGYAITPKKIASSEMVNEESIPVEISDKVNQEETGLNTESIEEPIEPNIADTIAEISRLMQSGDMLSAAQLSQTLDMPMAEVEELVQKYETDQLTPATEEAVIEDTPTGKVEVEYTDRDMLIKEIEKVDEQLDALDAAMIDLEDNYGTSEEKAAIRTEIKKLNAKKQKLFNQEKKISKAEEDAAVAIDRDKESNDDDYFSSADIENAKSIFNTKAEQKDYNTLNNVLDHIKSKIRSHVLKDVDIVPISSLENLSKEELSFLSKRYEKGPFVGLFVPKGHKIGKKSLKKARIYIVAKKGNLDTDYMSTLYHELVGHYGLRKMFGDMLTPFKEKLLIVRLNGITKVRDPKFAAKVFSLHERWTDIDPFKLQGKNDEWIEVPDIYKHYSFYNKRLSTTLSDSFTLKGKDQRRMKVKVSKNAMLRLTEEYLSELAADYSKPEVQKTLKKKPLYKRYIAAIRHALRKIGFGKIVGTITDEELMEHMAQSHTRIMVDGVQAIDYDKAFAYMNHLADNPIKDKRTGQKIYLKDLTQEEIEDMLGPILEEKFGVLPETTLLKRYFSTFISHKNEMASAVPNMPEDVKSNISEGIAAASASVEEGVRNGAITEDQAKRTYDMYMKGFGLINKKNFWNKKVNPIIDRAINKIRDSKYSHQFLAMGKLPARELYSWVENIAKGGISKGEIFARKWSKALMNLSDNQSEAVYNFFKTKNAEASDLPISKELQKMAEQAKNYIDDFGERLVNLGLLDRDTFEENRGSYLPVVYYKYMKEYAGSGKKMSFANYLKKKADIPDAERQAMGQMKDPGFLVAHTVATLSRDIALHEMFNNIRTMSETNGLGWVIPSPKKYKVDGRAYRIEQLEEALEDLKLRYSLDEGTKPNFMNSAGKSALEDKINRFQEQYAIALEDQKDEFKKILIRRAEQNGETLNPEDITDEQLKDFRTAEFRKIDDIRFGKANKGGLNGQYVRIEIYNDLVESTNMFNKEHSDFLGKIFGEGGTADKAHQYWKLVKVAGNPPSWFRNGVSNALLLDMATDTNFGSLLNMIVEEGHFAIAQKRSKWGQIAHDYGVFSTTWAAVETSLITRKYQDKYLADIKLKQNDYTKMGYLKALFDGKVADMLEKVSAIYGGIEGIFKTVAIRDHIQQWEKNTGKKFDNLVGDEREAVIMQAVEFANKAIFDYSKVPQWVRFARRTPFVGAPFITFTIKAIPATIEGFARHPQKMIKYAMLPYAMMQAWLLNNDLDDDDWDEVQKNLPTWQREKGSLYLLPWKDSNGNIGVVDIGYYLPWSSMYNAGLTMYNEVNKFNPITSLGAGTLKALQSDLGILGGLFPTMGVALATGIDPFTDREIVDPINTEEGKAVQYMRFMSNLVFPSFLTSRGALGKTMDYFGVKPTPLNTGRELTTSGTPRQTALDVAGRYVGLNTYSVNLDEAKAANAREISAEIYKYKQAFNKVARDMNMSSIDKAAKIRSLAEQMKYKVQKYQERVQ